MSTDMLCGEAPLFVGGGDIMSLAETSAISRFSAWRGRSGRRFVTTVFTVDRSSIDVGLPELDEVIVIPVRRRETLRLPIGIFEIENHADRRAVLSSGLANGADEWHVHLLAATRAARKAAVLDLRGRHPTETFARADCA